MNQDELEKQLNSLIANWENEVIEFKEAGDGFSTNDIGKYFSALSNEANLRNQEKSWLVFGVNDKSRSVVGTAYRPEAERLQSLKMQIAESTEPSVTFRNVFEINHADGRVILFEIPAAPLGMPIAWKGHYYARAGESLVAMGQDKHDEIRNQTIATDWSAQVIEAATIDDLDPRALQKARDSFSKKYANRIPSEDVEGWSTENFLNKTKLMQGGKITRAAILLLGKESSAYLLNPHPTQLTWKLEGEERAYEHFSTPFLLNSTRLYKNIRNIQLRILPQDELIPIEVSKYDQKVVLEALHNCIAHQDYTRNGRIIVTEYPDKLTLENEGSFFEGKPSDYIPGEKTPRRYRNPFLAQAMAELNMIDTMGYGIHLMHTNQAKRYFPMPDYYLSEDQSVCATIYGGVVDPAYSRLLIKKTDLELADILALDRVQKKLPIPDDKAKQLRRNGLIEGRKPNYHVSASVAAVTASKADYIHTRAFDNNYYKKLITDYLAEFKKASRTDIDKLIQPKISDALSESQKTKKTGNLLTSLRRAKVIYNAGSRTVPEWRLLQDS